MREEDRVRDLARQLANDDALVFQFLSEDTKNMYRTRARLMLGRIKDCGNS